MAAADEVSDQVRDQVHMLSRRVSPSVVENVALAMVTGAARAYLEIAGDDAEGRTPERRLLDALPLDVGATLRRSLS